MNDNLQELVFEAYRRCEKKTYGWLRNEAEFRQKFAGVIVEECIRIVEDAVDHREPASTYAGKLREHFGVEK
jgi:hypothetical protein